MKIQKTTAPSPIGEITLYTLTNSAGASVTLSSLGAGINSVVVPDASGKMDNVVLGYRDPASYIADGPCAGKVPGRFANRIAKGHFTIGDKEYTLPINNGPNSLHGGPDGFMNRIWNSRLDGDTVVFELTSPDGDAGYPGELQAEARYTWSDDCTLTLRLLAHTDAPTVVNLTNHTYWNLEGENSGSVLDHTLWLAASHYLPTDDTLIPTGEIAPVEGTPMDFTQFRRLGDDIHADFPAITYGKGYDNCWMVDDYRPGVLRHIATLNAPHSGRVLEVSTTQPAAQVYAGCWLAGSPENPEGRSYNDYDGVAIECQNAPDAPNKPQFPSALLLPGQTYDQTITFHISAK
ncbi:MAG TPA: galactose-1-epimerase [Porphyromonadaceae bacterium]|nr:galactose mutarotase [Paramuribaculum sp.]HAB40442.1 galactose-1-epimerase [Porphyromonadaceae bacterium]